MGIIELVKQHVIEEAKEEGKEEGLKLGIETGIEKGMTKGELARARNVTKRIIEKYPAWSDEEVADLVEMTVSIVKKIRREMQKKKP